MNRFEGSSEPSLPRMWMAPNTPFQYQDTALEAAHLEIERLQNANAVQQLLLDEATSRISDLARYRAKAATIIAHLTAKIRAQRKTGTARTSSRQGRFHSSSNAVAPR